MAANEASSDWTLDALDVEFTVAEDQGAYETVEGEIFAVASIHDLLGNLVPTSEYTTLYFDSDNELVGDSGNVASYNGRLGGAPDTAGTYTLYIIKGKVEPTAGQTTSDFSANTKIEVPFTVVKETKSLEGAFAYQGNDEDTDSTADVAFDYTGDSIKVGFAVDGKQLAEDVDYTTVWTQLPTGADGATVAAPVFDDDLIDATVDAEIGGYPITQAGTYTARITAVEGGNYAGSAVVTFTVGAIYLSADDVVIAPVETTPGLVMTNGILANDQITVNGIDMENGAEIVATLIGKDDVEVKASELSSTYATTQTTPGKYTFRLTAAKVGGEASANVSGETTVDAYIVDHGVSYTYAGKAIPGSWSFSASYGEAFNPAYLGVEEITTTGGKDVTPAFDWSVTKDGQPVESYDEPGKYTLTMSTELGTYNNETYAGYETFDFTVEGREYTDAVVYALLDGELASAGASYTGAEIPLQVVVREDGATLAEGDDYTCALEYEGEAAEQVMQPGDYTLTVSFADGSKVEVEFTVAKAVILQARATADFFATDGTTAAVPSFEGSTADPAENEKFETGDVFTLAADQIDVTYARVTDFDAADANKNGKLDADEVAGASTTPVAADALTEEGWYVADINVLTTCETLKGSGVEAAFQVKETAGYNDVAADAWYADSVYKAKDNGYMEGVAAGIFAPEKAMTRAEFAQVVANMAGVGKAGIGETYPTQFSDVPADAWYAKAVEWAARYGIVTGTSETTFAPNETISREQIAAMFYRYAGNGAEADLAVLDQFEDADQVSGWAKEAMAWAIEEGYMNGTSETTLAPSETAQRAQIAAIAVRVQPERL